MPDRPPEVRLDGDGKHILWSHECNFAYALLDSWDPDDPSTWDYWHPDVRLPINDERGWRIENTEPLTVSPSILCGSCGTHGWWRDGRWVPA